MTHLSNFQWPQTSKKPKTNPRIWPNQLLAKISQPQVCLDSWPHHTGVQMNNRDSTYRSSCESRVGLFRVSTNWRIFLIATSARSANIRSNPTYPISRKSLCKPHLYTTYIAKLSNPIKISAVNCFPGFRSSAKQPVDFLTRLIENFLWLEASMQNIRTRAQK